MSEQTTDLTIVRKENVQMIAQSAPQIYKDNTTSSERCTEYGQKLLEQIKANGMNDELDMQCANYINKARNTVKKMIDDGRMRWAYAGTMVDVRSMAEYIESPAQADRRARAAKNSNFGQSRFSV